MAKIRPNERARKELLLQDENYQKYNEEKEKLKTKYPPNIFGSCDVGRRNVPYSEEERKLHKDYLHEVGNLIFDGHGYFQKFCWENITDAEQIIQDRKARGRKKGIIDY